MEELLSFIPVLGSLANSAAVLVGGCLGLLLRSRFPERLSTITFQAMGLFTLSLGVSMAIKSTNPLVLVFSILPGAVIGDFQKKESHS